MNTISTSYTQPNHLLNYHNSANSTDSLPFSQSNRISNEEMELYSKPIEMPPFDPLISTHHDFRQNIFACTGDGTQVSGMISQSGISDLCISLRSGQSIRIDTLIGNVRISDRDNGEIEIVTNEFTRVYDQEGHIIEEIGGGSPLDGTEKGDIIFNINGANINGNNGNDSIFTLPGNLNINGGDGDDKVYVIDAMGSGHTMNVSLGSGNDSFKFFGNNSSPTDHKLYLDAGEGNDNININRSISGGRIDAGNGNDSITSSELLHNLTILGGNGNNQITLKALSNSHIDAGDGTNFISIESLFSSELINGKSTSIFIKNHYIDVISVFTKNRNGEWSPNLGATVDGKHQLSIKI